MPSYDALLLRDQPKRQAHRDHTLQGHFAAACRVRGSLGRERHAISENICFEFIAGMDSRIWRANCNRKGMFRLTLRTASNSTVFVLEGTLSGLWAKELLRAAREHDVGCGVIFDLQRLSQIDSNGEEVLRILNRRGGKFITASLYGKNLCKRLKLSQAVTPDDPKQECKRLSFHRRGRPQAVSGDVLAGAEAGALGSVIGDDGTPFHATEIE